MARLELEALSKHFGHTIAVRDVSLAVGDGEFVVLLGPSGCGKTTTLRMIAGFVTPTGGRVRLGGHDVTGLPPWKRNTGMVFQSYALFPHLTVAQNVAFGLQMRQVPKLDIAPRVAEALRLVRLQGLSERLPRQLSGGQQQRVALARALVIRPDALLLDEPLSNLDAQLRVHMRGELLALQRQLGITTIFVTHDQEEALSIADRVAVLDRGIIQQIGTPMDLFDRPANRFIASFVGTINLLRGQTRPAAQGVVFESPLVGDIHLPAATGAGGAAEIAFRPHTLTLAAPGSSEARPDRIWVKGTVAEREFLGEFIRYRIDVQGTPIVADQTHFSGNVEFAPGHPVDVGIEPTQVRLLPL